MPCVERFTVNDRRGCEGISIFVAVGAIMEGVLGADAIDSALSLSGGEIRAGGGLDNGDASGGEPISDRVPAECAGVRRTVRSDFLLLLEMEGRLECSSPSTRVEPVEAVPETMLLMLLVWSVAELVVLVMPTVVAAALVAMHREMLPGVLPLFAVEMTEEFGMSRPSSPLLLDLAVDPLFVPASVALVASFPVVTAPVELLLDLLDGSSIDWCLPAP